MKTTRAIFGVLKITLGLTGRICTSSLVPLLLLLWILPVLGAQAAVVFTSLYSFTGTNDGANPQAALVQGNDGNFYGTTFGSAYGYGPFGTVFKISPNGTLTTLHSFYVNDGQDIYAGLVQGNNGSFYGTTSGGGTNGGFGTVFKISTNGVLTTLCSFSGTDGASPQAALVQGSDGYFYGTTYNPDTKGFGTVFRISTNGALTSLYSFTGGSDGGEPSAGLVQGSDGSFYGTTSEGGTNGEFGTVFKIDTSGALTTLYAFGSITNAYGDPADGVWPNGLVQGSDGNFYGTTGYDGWRSVKGVGFRVGYGGVFKISANGALTGLYPFGSVQDTNGLPLDGANPFGGLVQGSDGNFYGTTYHGGMNGYGYGGFGTVFRISTNGALTSLYSFTGGSDGANPCAALVQGSDGSFYGTTPWGGTYGNGTVFRLTIVPHPQLTLIPSGPYVILTWPTNFAGFTLQSTTNVGSLAFWTTNSSPPVVIGGQNVVINTISGRQQFYRLSQRLPHPTITHEMRERSFP